MIKGICTGLIRWISFEYPEDDKFKGSINRICLDIPEIFIDDIVLIKFYLTLK